MLQNRVGRESRAVSWVWKEPLVESNMAKGGRRDCGSFCKGGMRKEEDVKMDCCL